MRSTSRRTRGVSLLLAIACGLAVGCGREPTEPRPPALTRSRATLVLEPPRLRVGEVAELEISVITPPGHAVRPFETPTEVPGLWVLDSKDAGAHEAPGRRVHSTRVRLRTRDVGQFEWPGGSVEVESPEGEVSSVSYEALPIEVVSVMPNHLGRGAPFGLPPPLAADSRPTRRWPWAAGGALAAWLGLAGARWVRRRAKALEATSVMQAAPPVAPPWDAALAALAAAESSAATRPLDASHRAAAALRHYVDHRYRTDTVARTTEELAATEPPFAATSRWPGFVSLMRDFDELRFRPQPDETRGPPMRHRAAELVRSARDFVRETIPLESRP